MVVGVTSKPKFCSRGSTNSSLTFKKRLPNGATIVPLIISSDKTLLSNFRGDCSAWPVYLTIGNIGKETRRQVSSHATVLLGYIPIPKFDCFDEKTRSLAKYRTFHYCMSIITKSVAEAGKSKTGVEMVCSDAYVRNIWPIFAAYVADYPEQCLIACCMENRCPICSVPPTERGNHTCHPKRTKEETLFYLRRKRGGQSDTAFKTYGLRAVYSPFWKDLPYSDIFQGFTPDLLHQLHKGVFKDHVVKWATEIIGKDEVDARFRAMPSHPNLRHFKNGISHVSQWTGTEHKEMEKVFLGIVSSDTADSGVIKAVRGLVDFTYYASLQSHTTITLLGLRNALNEFHANKEAFIKLGGRDQPHFNIPKVHSLEHYEELIRQFGTADGFNTESPERLHIDYAKEAYRASNRRDYISQMTRWLQRQEAVDRFTVYLAWTKTLSQPPIMAVDKFDIDSEDFLVSRDATYSIAARPPPASRRIAASYIISPEGHNASRFLDALTTFFVAAGSPFVPREFDVFGLWKRLVFKLPNIPEVGARHGHNVVRAAGPVISTTNGRRRAEEPAHLDFALIRTGEANTFTDGTSLKGLRVAQVRAIFQLPSHYPIKSTLPLAYIEWFTPLRNLDTITGYYHIARSMRSKRGVNGPYAEIVSVDRIVRNCMLIPRKRGEANKFFLNSHIDSHSFCMFKLGQYDCIP